MLRSDSGRLIRSKAIFTSSGIAARVPTEMFSHEQTDPEAKGGPGQGQQSIQGQCIRRFWNG